MTDASTGRVPPALANVWAKSPRAGEGPVLLTTHLEETLSAAGVIARRLGALAPLAALPDGDRFWLWVRWAALLHDAGKAAEGFQTMLETGEPWGERHEVLSLGFVDDVCARLPLEDRHWIALGIATHHRAFEESPAATSRRAPRSLTAIYDEPLLSVPARLGPVTAGRVAALAGWLAAHAPEPSGQALADDALLERTAVALESLFQAWVDGDFAAIPGIAVQGANERGLVAVLLQGAVTMADHLSSAHAQLTSRQPLPADYFAQFSKRHRPLPHQESAATCRGHVIVVAPTGTGKTEAMLSWAAEQVVDLPGEPRVFYVLPFQASINAMTQRLAADLDVDVDQIGLVHSRAAQTLLQWSIDEGGAEDGNEVAVQVQVQLAQKARARRAMTRLFRERLRVGTPYQLLRGALLGAKYSANLLDAANSVFILDELHAYEPVRFGYLLAMAAMWERLGSRIGVASATLPRPIRDLIDESLAEPVTLVEADKGHSASLIRHVIQLGQHELQATETLELVRERLAAGEAVLVVANTIARAREIFLSLAPVGCPVRDHAILLHSQFRARDRGAIERRIQGRCRTFGPRTGGLVVATQVIEVSLDVDFDVVFTEAAPLDALLQRFGRVNRCATRAPADVWVCPRQPVSRLPSTVDGIYPLAAVQLAWEVLERSDGQTLSESDTEAWLTYVYESEWGRGWTADVRRTRDMFAAAFLDLSRPFQDRSHLDRLFDEMFEGTEIVAADDLATYQEAAQLDPLLAAGFLIPKSVRPYEYSKGLVQVDPVTGVRYMHGTYDAVTGFEPGSPKGVVL